MSYVYACGALYKDCARQSRVQLKGRMGAAVHGAQILPLAPTNTRGRCFCFFLITAALIYILYIVYNYFFRVFEHLFSWRATGRARRRFVSGRERDSPVALRVVPVGESKGSVRRQVCPAAPRPTDRGGVRRRVRNYTFFNRSLYSASLLYNNSSSSGTPRLRPRAPVYAADRRGRNVRGNGVWARDSRVERELRARFSRVEEKKEEKMRELTYIHAFGVKGAGVSAMLNVYIIEL